MNKLLIATILALFLFTYVVTNEATPTTKKHYIVYMGEHSYPDSDSVISANYDLLASITGSMRQAKEAAIHHYSKSFRGFSAILTAEQAQQLRESDSVISVVENIRNHGVTMVSSRGKPTDVDPWTSPKISSPLPPSNSSSDVDVVICFLKINGVFESDVWNCMFWSKLGFGFDTCYINDKD